MDKIIQLALGLSYPTDKLLALQNVISATPNPTMATEILLGVYEKPVIPNKVKDSKGVVRLLKSKDDWKEEVNYTFLQPKRIGNYYPKGTLEKDLNDDNYESLKSKSSDDDTTYLYFNSKTMEERTGSCAYSDWLAFENLQPKQSIEDLYAE